MPSRPYKYISEIYSHLMSHIDYDEWAEYYFNLTKKFLPKNSKVLELASGNGILAKRLLKYFPDITITDLSFEMLKNSSSNLKAVCCDMTKLPFNTKFDLIICAFDSVNYLITRKALQELFRSVYDLLSPGGIFSFDASLENNSIRNGKQLNKKGKFNGIKYIQKSRYDERNKIHYNDFEIIHSDGSKYFETHKQKIFPVELYFELLVENKFYIRNCYDAFSLCDADEDSERVQFVTFKDKSKCLV